MNRTKLPSSLAVWLRRFEVMVAKEFLQLWRDRLLLGFIALAFTLDVYMSGSGVSFELQRAPMVVHDEDRTAASRDLIDRFRPPQFILRGQIASAEEGTRLLDRGEVMMVLGIPPRFEQSLRQGEPIDVQLRIDTTNAVLAGLAEAYATEIVGRFAQEARPGGLGAAARGGTPRVVDENRVLFNPNQNDRWFFSISELLQVITLFSILLPAAVLAREKERGTVEQLLVSPLTPLQVLLPKLFAMTVVILAATAVSLFGILGPVFQVPMRGSLVLFFVVTGLYIFATAGLGMFAATMARNLAQVALLTIVILAPMMFLSGTFAPPEAMPTWMRLLVYLSPLYYYINASYGILLKGAGVGLLWDTILKIAVLGGGIFALGLWKFRRSSR